MKFNQFHLLILLLVLGSTRFQIASAQQASPFHLHFHARYLNSERGGESVSNFRQLSRDLTANIWGLEETFTTQKKSGLGAQISLERISSKRLFTALGMGWEFVQSKEIRTSSDEVPYLRVKSSRVEYTERMHSFSPVVQIGGAWKDLVLSAGFQMNCFLKGTTHRLVTRSLTGGLTEIQEHTGPISTQEVIISSAIDPDFWTINPGFHKFWFAAVGELKYQLDWIKFAPSIGLSYRLPLSDFKFGQSPNWAVYRGYNHGTGEPANLGTRLTTVAVSLGLQIW